VEGVTRIPKWGAKRGKGTDLQLLDAFVMQCDHLLLGKWLPRLVIHLEVQEVLDEAELLAE